MKALKHLCLAASPFFVSPAFAVCPEDVGVGEALVEIVENMRDAPSEASARQFSNAMWEIWLDAPDELAQAMLDEGLATQRYGDYDASRAVLSELIAYCPTYAEGYNQRAYAAFLSFDFEAALVDLDIAIDLQPVHLGALTGKARTLIELGRDDEAQVVLREALDINPWLAERHLLDGSIESDI
ncbi:hypothetical protein Q4555_04310 [Octadecabacter sp. 1_MG-2023]|uniref:tetratricopeptide repeat protein n=1 Tax=unclassified Octadecabacter TaxID=196158 RepID=UPI001C0A2687|nr:MULTISPECIES: hypothetical protein [unclassified Octadecabacter]MBU2992673.1 hypothetical protein [Octadecabacter sp. B2R22]MDO6733876.1 hypothetical protein [Octadecabacter sp. 1_MG-2023]